MCGMQKSVDKKQKIEEQLKTARFKLSKERLAQMTDEDNTSPNCPESSHEPCDDVTQSSHSDTDTDDEYILEEEGSRDLSEDSDDDVGEDRKDEIFHSVKREDRTDNIRKQPKFVVFLTQLLLLFKTCVFCHQKEPVLKVSQVETMVTITTSCQNPECIGKTLFGKASH